MHIDGIASFNALPSPVAEDRLYACLANRRWAREVASGRPYLDEAALRDAVAARMEALTDGEWLEALKAHPRIGERGGDTPASSDREQSSALQAPTQTLVELAAENRRYEDRFGHVFLIAASGKSADDILAELRRRMSNSREAELREAKRELGKIAQLRLGQLIRS